jgi:hypothetical protein
MKATRAELDAKELMVKDLQTFNEEIRHRASFRQCEKELEQMKNVLIAYLNEVYE